MQQPTGRVLRILVGSSDQEPSDANDNWGQDRTPFHPNLPTTSSDSSISEGNLYPAPATPNQCPQSIHAPGATGPTQHRLSKNQLRLKRKQRIKRKRNQEKKRKNKQRRRKERNSKLHGATSPQSPKGDRARCFRAHLTRAVVSVHHLHTMKDAKTQGRDHKGIKGLIDKFRASITPPRPDQTFYKTLTHHCDSLYQGTVKNLENLHIRNALKGVEKAMLYYHAPTAASEVTTALCFARVQRNKLHPLAAHLTRTLLHTHITARKHKNTTPLSHSNLRHIIDFEGPPEGTLLPTHISSLSTQNYVDKDDEDLTSPWVLSLMDLPLSHIHIPLPTLKFGDWPPVQQFPKTSTYAGDYPQAPSLTIFNVLHSLDVHRTHPPHSFPKNRIRRIYTDNAADKLSLYQLLTKGELPLWAGNIADAPLAYPEPLIADSVSNSEFYRDHWYPQIAKAYLTLAIKDPKVLYNICNPHTQSFENMGTDDFQWPAYPIKLMNLAAWHVRHLLFDFAAYFVDNSSRFSRFRATMDHYPVQGVLAGTLRNILIKEDEAGHISFQPPPELSFWEDFLDSDEELVSDYMDTCSPQPSTYNQLVPRLPTTTNPPPTQGGTPLGQGFGDLLTTTDRPHF